MGVDSFFQGVEYAYNDLIRVVNSGWNDTPGEYYDSESDTYRQHEDGAHRRYKTKAEYAKYLDSSRERLYQNQRQGNHGIDNGSYFNSVTRGMDRDGKVDTFLNGYLGQEDFTFDDGSTFSRKTGDSVRLNSKGARYQLQEYLGETVEGYVKRRDESKRRDALRKQMLAEKDIIDGGKSKQQTTEGGLG